MYSLVWKWKLSAHLFGSSCEPPWNQYTVVTSELVYICWVTLAELIWLCPTRFHWSMSLCYSAVVFNVMWTAHAGRKVLCCSGVLSAVAVLLQCLSISSIRSLSHTVTETLVKFMCVTCCFFFYVPPKAKFKAGVEDQGDIWNVLWWWSLLLLY